MLMPIHSAKNSLCKKKEEKKQTTTHGRPIHHSGREQQAGWRKGRSGRSRVYQADRWSRALIRTIKTENHRVLLAELGKPSSDSV